MEVIMNKHSDDKRKRAEKRVEKIKGFYIHFAVYLIVNAFILVNIYMHTSSSDDGFWRLEHFSTLFFWGLGVLFHAINTFGNPFFNKNWEEQQIKKIIEKDRKEADKYR